MRLVVLLALVIACTEPQLDDHSAILPFSEVLARKGSAPYAPTADDIRRLRAALPTVVPPSIAARTASYYGQFMGYVDTSDRRWIRANFICKVDGDGWRHGTIAVMGGGDCYFHLEWSPDTNTTRNLEVNSDI